MKTYKAVNGKHLKLIIKREIEKLGPNADLNHIDVSKVKDIDGLFSGLSFKGDISKWEFLSGDRTDVLPPYSRSLLRKNQNSNYRKRRIRGRGSNPAAPVRNWAAGS